jgi:hypothetical protein
MFDDDLSGDLVGCSQQPVGRIGVKKMAIFSNRRHSWLYIIWVLIGIVVAWERHYITVEMLKLAASAILAIFLWPLVLLGVSLHIH